MNKPLTLNQAWDQMPENVEGGQEMNEKEIKILQKKAQQLNNMPLCPDCRDKVRGLPCLRCTIQTLTRQRDALLDACKKVQNWLDTSSLQGVLVHRTDAKEKDALIMGVASHLIRLEQAIADAEKGQGNE